MKTISCREGDIINLEDCISNAQPVAMTLEPFSGEIAFEVKITGTESAKALAYCLRQTERGTATNPVYSSGLLGVPNCFLLLIAGEAGYLCLTCLSHKDLTVRLSGQSASALQVRAQSGTSRMANQERPALLCVQGDNIFQTVSLSMRQALQLTGGKGKLALEKPGLPQWLDTLGWGSGAAYGREVTHDKVLNAVWGLRQQGVQPGYVLIDEGWQRSAHRKNGPEKYSPMRSFEADPERFPYGMKGLVEELHRAGVHHVGVWHGIMGSRGGIHPRLAEAYNLPPDPQGRYFLGYDLGRTFQFYYDFYGSLKEQGVSFVKIGGQNDARNFCRKGMDATKVFQNLQVAVQAAASIQFDTPPFNTECLRNENLFYWTTSRLASACDDLDTQDPSGCKTAIRDLLANSLWLQHLMKPDFSAWTTGMEHSPALGILHALSSSINVISDPPGNNDQQLIRKMALPSGKILKSDKALTLCEECVFADPLVESGIYKAFTKKADKGAVCAFNLFKEAKTLHGQVSPRDVAGIVGTKFAVFSHRNGFVGILEKNQEMPLTLKPGQSDIIIFSPVTDGVALVGSYHFYLSPGPITEMTVEEESVHISSMVTAPMVMYCERQVLEIRRNGEVIPWEFDKDKKLLTFDSRSNLLELPAMYTISFE